jgi:hypothetical protein
VLEGIGERVALAVENAQLHEQVLDRAVLEERERIARELHDGLAQVLGYIIADQAVKLLASERSASDSRWTDGHPSRGRCTQTWGPSLAAGIGGARSRADC